MGKDPRCSWLEVVRAKSSICYLCGHEDLRGRREGVSVGELGHQLSSKEEMGSLKIFLKSQSWVDSLSNSPLSCNKVIIRWSPLAVPI